MVEEVKKMANMKDYVIIGLLVVIIGILLTQPIITTEVQTVDWVSDDELWQFGEVQIADLDDEWNWQQLPEVYGDKIVYMRKVSGLNNDIAMFDVSEQSRTIIDNRTTEQRLPHIWGDRVVWCEVDYSDSPYYFNIWMKDLTSNVTSILVDHPDENCYLPRIYDNILVYHNYSSLILRHLDTATEYSISDVLGDTTHDIDGNYVVFNVYNEGLYIHNIEENTTTLVVDRPFIQRPRISGNNVVYSDFVDGIWTSVYYNIEVNRTYSFFNDDPYWLGSTQSDIYEDNIVMTSEYTWSYGFDQILMTEIPTSQFQESFSKATNDTWQRWNCRISSDLIVWEQFEAFTPTRSSTPYEHDVVYMTYEEYEGAFVIPEIESQTVVDTGWVNILLILSLGLVATIMLYLNEEGVFGLKGFTWGKK